MTQTEANAAAEASPSKTGSILDAYVLDRPTDQNILDLFDGEWSSALPANLGLTTAPGTAQLFDDGRITWFGELIGGFLDRRVLELGPLEGGHSYMLQKGGATEIVAIEANSRAFLKCLCVKEILDLDRVRFLLGDFVQYLASTPQKFDALVASGVLYHMQDPVGLIRAMADTADAVMVWTHYYDHGVITGRDDLDRKFEAVSTASEAGYTYEFSTQSYNEALDWDGFCGGPETQSKWLTRDSLLGAFSHFGFTKVDVGFDQIDHPNGPAIAICARR